jgi:CO/xanthine dehydrogenase Mo-binding subunit
MARQQLEGMLVTGVSRVLLEQTTFSKRRVTSLDWVGYPTLRFRDHPTVTTALMWRQDELAENTSLNSGYNGPKYRGVGESLIVPTVSAIGNAFFDATGVRMRRAPMTPAAVRAALAAGGRLFKA